MGEHSALGQGHDQLAQIAGAGELGQGGGQRGLVAHGLSAAQGIAQELAPDGLVGQAVKSGNVSLYPSRIPQIIGMTYAGMLLMPLVIEGAPYALTVPRERGGAMLSQSITLTLATLTSIDATDWANAMAGSHSN